MSVRKSFDHRLNDWLDEGPQVAPPDLLHAVLEELPAHRQDRRRFVVGRWRMPMFTFGRLGLAAVVVALLAGVIIAARPTLPVGNRASATPGSSSRFTSKFYAYSISVPPGWTARNAFEPWNGYGAPVIEDGTVDVIDSPRHFTAVIASAAPTSESLAAYVAEGIRTNAAVNSDTCPAAAHPESVESITVGGESGKLVSINCGILINVAFTVHDGMGYRFIFRDTGVQAATNLSDKATFTAMLKSVEFK
jgi:hypothetical protein